MAGDSCPYVHRTRHPSTVIKPRNTRKTGIYANKLEKAEIHIHMKSPTVL